MTKLKAGVGAVAGALLLAAPAWGIGGASKLEQLRGGEGTAPAKSIALTSTVTRKRARSCNAGSNRKGTRQSPAAVNAWAVACEFPPRSQTIPSGALQNAVATAAILGS
jgi:hypothetical protein